jgi:hypothetical protein
LPLANDPQFPELLADPKKKLGIPGHHERRRSQFVYLFFSIHLSISKKPLKPSPQPPVSAQSNLSTRPQEDRYWSLTEIC